MQVEVGLCAQNLQIVLPAGLPGLEKSDGDYGHSEGTASSDIDSCVLLAVPELQMQLRLHDHYMGEWFTLLVLGATLIESSIHS